MSWPQLLLGIGSMGVGAMLFLRGRQVVRNREPHGAMGLVFTAAGGMLMLNGALQAYLGLSQ